MSNPLSAVSPQHAAALELTLAMIAKLDLGQPFNHMDSQDKKAAARAEFVSTFFNSVLSNIQDKS